MEDEDTVPVSVKIPFLSNLSVLENIKLVAEVRERSSNNKVQERAMEKLRALEMEELSATHFTSLDDLHYFWVQIIRAHMLEECRMVIDRPFVFVPGQRNMDFILQALERLNIDFDRVTIIELVSEQHNFREDICDITKWQ
ncbi:MAG: hypothetical protein OEW60_06120 [Thiovulaceae bacterium]|nr:hypothetical protein [Sulfurimonadaceae bacterium]